MESYSRIKTKEDYRCFHHDIEIRPALWDHRLTTNTTTNNNIKKDKQQAWTDLSRIYSIKDFDELTPTEKKYLRNDLQMKWKHSRLAFAREYSKWYNKGGLIKNLDKAKKYKNGSKKTKFIDHLLFLIPVFETKEWDGKYESDVRKRKADSDDDEDTTGHHSTPPVFVKSTDHQHYVHYIIPPVLHDIPSKVVVASDRVLDVTQDLEQNVVMEQSDPNLHEEIVLDSKQIPQMIENVMPKNSAPGDPFGSLDDVNSLMEEVSPRDEDEMFLLSLLSHLREVPRHKKLIARCEMMQVLLKHEGGKS